MQLKYTNNLSTLIIIFLHRLASILGFRVVGGGGIMIKREIFTVKFSLKAFHVAMLTDFWGVRASISYSHDPETKLSREIKSG
jgi:hypothetical protein